MSKGRRCRACGNYGNDCLQNPRCIVYRTVDQTVDEVSFLLTSEQQARIASEHGIEVTKRVKAYRKGDKRHPVYMYTVKEQWVCLVLDRPRVSLVRRHQDMHTTFAVKQRPDAVASVLSLGGIDKMFDLIERYRVADLEAFRNHQPPGAV